MEHRESFKTSRGYCHVLSDRIIFTKAKKPTDTNTISSNYILTTLLVIYGLISIFLLYKAYLNYQSENWLLVVLFLVGVAYLVYEISRSINYSTTEMIKRDAIINIAFRPVKPFVRRSHFRIKFKNEKGKEKTRLIILPRSFKFTEKDTKKAMRVMKRSGLI